MARSAQTPSRSAGGISGKRLRKTGVEREEGPASRAGIDRVRVVRLELLIVLVLVLDFFLIYTEGRGLVVLWIALFSDPRSLLAATVQRSSTRTIEWGSHQALE